MKIGIGNDHVAVEYKEAIAAYIQAMCMISVFSGTPSKTVRNSRVLETDSLGG